MTLSPNGRASATLEFYMQDNEYGHLKDTANTYSLYLPTVTVWKDDGPNLEEIGQYGLSFTSVDATSWTEPKEMLSNKVAPILEKTLGKLFQGR